MTIFFGWIKLLKYVAFNKTMTQLSRTLVKVRRRRMAVVYVIVARHVNEYSWTYIWVALTAEAHLRIPTSVRRSGKCL
jgi:hypothetical protein